MLALSVVHKCSLIKCALQDAGVFYMLTLK